MESISPPARSTGLLNYGPKIPSLFDVIMKQSHNGFKLCFPVCFVGTNGQRLTDSGQQRLNTIMLRRFYCPCSIKRKTFFKSLLFVHPRIFYLQVLEVFRCLSALSAFVYFIHLEFPYIVKKSYHRTCHSLVQYRGYQTWLAVACSHLLPRKEFQFTRD